VQIYDRLKHRLSTTFCPLYILILLCMQSSSPLFSLTLYSVYSLPRFQYLLSSVQYDGKRVVSGAYDYLVRVWDPVEGTCLHVLQGHTNRVYSLQVSTHYFDCMWMYVLATLCSPLSLPQFDGVHIVSGSLDTSIRVWNADTGQCIHTLTG